MNIYPIEYDTLEISDQISSTNYIVKWVLSWLHFLFRSTWPIHTLPVKIIWLPSKIFIFHPKSVIQVFLSHIRYKLNQEKNQTKKQKQKQNKKKQNNKIKTKQNK